MKKENLVTLILSAIGGICFALGMCMCLLREWNSFREGIVMGTAGLLFLATTVFVRRKMVGKTPISFSKKTMGIITLAVCGALLLGVGMCMTMVWEGLLIPGIFTGIIGIVLLLCLIPLCQGDMPQDAQKK